MSHHYAFSTADLSYCRTRWLIDNSHAFNMAGRLARKHQQPVEIEKDGVYLSTALPSSETATGYSFKRKEPKVIQLRTLLQYVTDYGSAAREDEMRSSLHPDGRDAVHAHYVAVRGKLRDAIRDLYGRATEYHQEGED